MVKRLLARQASLLEYLTSGTAIIEGADAAILPPALHGFNPALLRLEARFSHEKRMEKIVAVFPRTFEILGDRSESIVRDFIRSCPSTDISRLSNARQFHDFLCRRWSDKAPSSPFLADIAACEFACARARLIREELQLTPASMAGPVTQHGLRRRPDVILLRCNYDVRAIFEEDTRHDDPPRRDTSVAIVMLPGDEHPRIFELNPVVFDLLTSLEDWIVPATLGLTSEHEPLIRELAEHHLIEVRP